MFAKPYIFKLDEEYQYQSDLTFDQDFVFFDSLHPWLSISRDGLITVACNYAWDGCTPKIEIFGMVVGTPDGEVSPCTGKPGTYWASLVHDALCQFQEHPDMPLSRGQIDYIFYQIMVRDEFKHADTYYCVVKKMGALYTKVSKRLIK